MRTLRRAALAACVALACAPASAPAGTLVALGDSFSSGEGAPPYETGTAERGRNTCHRSVHAWPLLVADQLGLAGRSWACSGAVVDDVVSDQVHRLAQMPDVGVVTLTIGGNDLGFGEVLRNCVLRNCRRLYTRDGTDVIAERIGRLAGQLPRVYRRVQAAAPGARLLVAGYPRLFPRRPGRFTCAALGTISRSEALFLNSKTAAADRAIRRAAARAHAIHTDVLDAFDGGEMRCGGGPRYVNGSFHPTAAGHARLAELALGAIAARVRDRWHGVTIRRARRRTVYERRIAGRLRGVLPRPSAVGAPVAARAPTRP
jgi:lysophospholipase L1-like esterase